MKIQLRAFYPMLVAFRNCVITLLVLFSCSFAHNVCAQADSRSESGKVLIGVVEKIDIERKTFTIKGTGGMDMQFIVNDKTFAESTNSIADFSRLKVGRSVGVRYRDQMNGDGLQVISFRPDGDIPPPPQIIYPPRKPPTNSPSARMP